MWVVRKQYTTALRRYTSYFTGAGYSEDPRSAVRFGQRKWAVDMLRSLGSSHAKVIRRRLRPRHRCECACCPCLVAQ